jgi:hypothetical protein
MNTHPPSSLNKDKPLWKSLLAATAVPVMYQAVGMIRKRRGLSLLSPLNLLLLLGAFFVERKVVAPRL